MLLDEWARVWNVPPHALADLRDRLSRDQHGSAPNVARNEADVQQLVRIDASRAGCRLWRNNVGGMYDETGRFVRYGLANETAAMNKTIKSADLIGIRPIHITAAHIGTCVGQFVSREIKAPGWRYTGNAKEQAQMAWAQLICAFGGDAAFCNDGRL